MKNFGGIHEQLKHIWESRTDNFQHIDTENPRAVFAELIRLDGYDSAGFNGAVVDYMAHQYETLKSALKAESVFEVGCGAGAWLYLFARDGCEIGGLDYSAALVNIAKKSSSCRQVDRNYLRGG